MPDKVEAWRDDQGRLWAKRQDAVRAEFNTKVASALRHFSNGTYEKLPIAAILDELGSTTYHARKELLDALLWYEENK